MPQQLFNFPYGTLSADVTMLAYALSAFDICLLRLQEYKPYYPCLPLFVCVVQAPPAGAPH